LKTITDLGNPEEDFVTIIQRNELHQKLDKNKTSVYLPNTQNL
jgi:hypothetical protein